MSLKGFHIVFIIFSTLLALGVGLWCVWVNLVEGAPVYLVGAIASFVAAVALVIFWGWFFWKMKRVRIITLERKSCRLSFYLFFCRLAKRWRVHFCSARR